jgi:hypothetical protein
MKICYQRVQLAEIEIVFAWCYEPDSETAPDTCRQTLLPQDPQPQPSAGGPHAAPGSKNSCCSAQDRRLAAPPGKQKTSVPLEHTILVIACHLIQPNEPYRELGGHSFDPRRPEATAKRLIQRLAQWGYAVSSPRPTPPAPASLFSRQPTYFSCSVEGNRLRLNV